VNHACSPRSDGSCSICGDVAEPASVISVNAADMTALVRLPGGPATIALDLVEGVSAGDIVMVHLGFAIAHFEGARR